jgi:CubicO group peptidase (beta-lactamase class C family)
MSWSNNSAAGGIYSSVHDMAKWITLQLDGGTLGKGADGQEHHLFSAARQREMWSLITPIKIAAPVVPALQPALPNFAGYGEGWFVSDYRGRKLVWHTGGWPGMVSRVTLVPELKLGVVVLTNQEIGAAFNALTYQILDAWIKPSATAATDWIEAYRTAVAKTQSGADASWQRHLAARHAQSAPSLPLAKYAGTYRDAWYGDIAIALQDGKLVMRFARTAQLVGDMQPWQHDTFFVRWRDRSLNADAFVSFALTPDGDIREARMQAASSLTDFSFDFQDLRLLPH